MKNLIMYFVLFTLLYSCNSNKTQQGDGEKQPNIIVILSDDQGWGDLSMNGNTNLSTPNIDKLAMSGATFNHFFVCPVCSPTRAELLTGRYHVRGGVYSTSAGGERLDLDETTIAEVFKKAGYHTAAFGKWHNGMQYPYHPNARGFDEFYGFCSGHWGNYFSPMLEHNGKIVRGNGFVIDDFTEKAMQFIEEYNPCKTGEPFFVYLPYNTPHSPMQVPEKWWDKFKDKKLQLTNRDPDKENILHTKAALAMCENIDWNVGRLMAKLEELKLEENTIVIYFSDNGPNGWRWNGGMKGKKGSTDEGGVRSPLIIRWKNTIQEGIVINQIASVIDLLPTLTELAQVGYNYPKPLDGISHKQALLNQNSELPERLIFNHWKDKTSVRSQKYRLSHEGMLFDMENDPGQNKDISEEEPEIKKELMAAKEKWEKEVNSELPEKDLRTFPVGHPDFKYTQIPARDAVFNGNIQRSNRFPNCSYLTNWKDAGDEIYWDVDVIADGNFEVVIYYTCPVEDVGSEFELSFENNKLAGKITEANRPSFIRNGK